MEFDYRRKYGCRAIKNLAEILFSAVTKTGERFTVFDKYEENMDLKRLQLYAQEPPRFTFWSSDNPILVCAEGASV